jgi:hypothetical protein
MTADAMALGVGSYFCLRLLAGVGTVQYEHFVDAL